MHWPGPQHHIVVDKYCWPYLFLRIWSKVKIVVNTLYCSGKPRQRLSLEQSGTDGGQYARTFVRIQTLGTEIFNSSKIECTSFLMRFVVLDFMRFWACSSFPKLLLSINVLACWLLSGTIGDFVKKNMYLHFWILYCTVSALKWETRIFLPRYYCTMVSVRIHRSLYAPVLYAPNVHHCASIKVSLRSDSLPKLEITVPVNRHSFCCCNESFEISYSNSILLIVMVFSPSLSQMF
jgi:hypothetical protein